MALLEHLLDHGKEKGLSKETLTSSIQDHYTRLIEDVSIHNIEKIKHIYVVSGIKPAFDERIIQEYYQRCLDKEGRVSALLDGTKALYKLYKLTKVIPNLPNDVIQHFYQQQIAEGHVVSLEEKFYNSSVNVIDLLGIQPIISKSLVQSMYMRFMVDESFGGGWDLKHKFAALKNISNRDISPALINAAYWRCLNTDPDIGGIENPIKKILAIHEATEVPLPFPNFFIQLMLRYCADTDDIDGMATLKNISGISPEFSIVDSTSQRYIAERNLNLLEKLSKISEEDHFYISPSKVLSSLGRRNNHYISFTPSSIQKMKEKENRDLQREYERSLRLGNIDHLRFLYTTTKIKPDLSEETVQKAYRSLVNKKGIDAISLISQLTPFTIIKPKFNKEQSRKLYSECIKSIAQSLHLSDVTIPLIKSLSMYVDEIPRLSSNLIQKAYTNLRSNSHVEMLYEATGIPPTENTMFQIYTKLGARPIVNLEHEKWDSEMEIPLLEKFTGIPRKFDEAAVQREYRWNISHAVVSRLEVIKKMTGILPTSGTVQEGYKRLVADRDSSGDIIPHLSNEQQVTQLKKIVRYKPRNDVYNAFFDFIFAKEKLQPHTRND